MHAYRGTVSVVAVPDAAQLDSYTTAVAENNHIATARQQLAGAARRATTPLPVPRRAGDPSLIEHVVYIIKENRTYDQLFGDLPKGNGDPSLVMFGEDVTPESSQARHRVRAARQLLRDRRQLRRRPSVGDAGQRDELRAVARLCRPQLSVRRHRSDRVCQHRVSLGSRARAREDGRASTASTPAACRRATRRSAPRCSSAGSNGEDFTREWTITAPLAPLNAVLARNYPPYSQSIPDVVRAQIFLKDLDEWTAAKARCRTW